MGFLTLLRVEKLGMEVEEEEDEGEANAVCIFLGGWGGRQALEVYGGHDTAQLL